MKAVVLGFDESHFLEGLSALKKLSEFLGKEFEYIALAVSKDELKLNGYDELHLVRSDSTYKALNSLIGHAIGLNPDVLVGINVKDSVDVIGRLAARMGRYMVTDVSSIIKSNEEIFLVRPILGARALAYYKYTEGVFFTISRGKFQPYKDSSEPKVIEVPLKEEEFRVIGREEKHRGAVDIESAEVVVGVGRGFKSKEDISMAMELATILGGEVGCSRPIAADLGWLGEDRWIGISGKKIRPKLYMPIGISGAPQHIMAANDSRIIVAVNKDKNAPIFNYSDYGVVADLYEFIPILIKVLKEKLKK